MTEALGHTAGIKQQTGRREKGTRFFPLPVWFCVFGVLSLFPVQRQVADEKGTPTRTLQSRGRVSFAQMFGSGAFPTAFRAFGENVCFK